PVAVVAATAAEVLRRGEAEDALLAGREPHVAVDQALLLPPLDVGRHLTGDELADDLAERLVVLVVQVTLHVGTPSGQPGRTPAAASIGRCRAGGCPPGRGSRDCASPGRRRSPPAGRR